MKTTTTTVTITSDPRADDWASKIQSAYNESVESFFKMGRLLIAAKEDLPHGRFEDMVRCGRLFSVGTARKLMAISKKEMLSNRSRVNDLPASWGTLYELTKWSDEELKTALDQYHPSLRSDTKRADLPEIRKKIRGSMRAAGMSLPSMRTTTEPKVKKTPATTITDITGTTTPDITNAVTMIHDETPMDASDAKLAELGIDMPADRLAGRFFFSDPDPDHAIRNLALMLDMTFKFEIDADTFDLDKISPDVLAESIDMIEDAMSNLILLLGRMKKASNAEEKAQ